jgi:hypothetical protein
MVHLAIYDAWHALSPTTGESYLEHRESCAAGASAHAAVAGAALAVLSELYVRQHDLFESKRREQFAALSGAGVPAAAMTAGYQHGRAIGLAMLARRDADGAAENGCYEPAAAPGYFRPDPFEPMPPLGVAWGHVTPFGIESLQILCNTMHPPWGAVAPGEFLTTPAYRGDLAEVAYHGGATAPNTAHNVEQTVIGLFWAYDGARNVGTAVRLYNQCVRSISAKCRFQPAQNALLFALVNMAMADATIAAWFGKFRFRVWRPVHGIREAAAGWGLSSPADGAIDATEPATGDIAAWLARARVKASTHVTDGWNADPLWRPRGMARTNAPGQHHRTPPSPAYPSGHSTAGAACFDVVFRFLRSAGLSASSARALTFTVVSDEFNGRSIDAAGYSRPRHVRTLTLGQAIRENAMGRLYLGVNWRASLVEGVRLGFAIASELASAGRGPAACLVDGSAVDALLPAPQLGP